VKKPCPAQGRGKKRRDFSARPQEKAATENRRATTWRPTTSRRRGRRGPRRAPGLARPKKKQNGAPREPVRQNIHGHRGDSGGCTRSIDTMAGLNGGDRWKRKKKNYETSAWAVSLPGERGREKWHSQSERGTEREVCTPWGRVKSAW